MAALESAVEVKADVIETDVHLTRDNELVLFHDEDLSRTTAQEGRLGDMTLDELREIDLGETFTVDGTNYPFRGKGLRIVTLREAFDRFPNVLFNIDMKDTRRATPGILADLLREYEREASVIVASFNDSQILRFREIAPEVRAAANPSQVRSFVIGFKLRLLRILVRSTPYDAFQVPVQSGNTLVVNDRFVKAAHDRGIAVHVWTINDREEMERLLDLGVDGIFTDRPALLRQVMEEKGFF